jgi:hypothetical protein
MRVHTVLLAATMAASVVLLGACGDGDIDSKTKASATPSTSTLPTVDRDGILSGNFVKDFRAKYPVLAKGRADESVANAGVLVCREVVKGDATRAGLLATATEAFTFKKAKPTEAEVLKIMELAVKDGCSDRWPALQTVVL